MIRALEERSRYLQSWTLALYLVWRDKRVPRYARLFVFCVVAYAVSPIDLVPDFVSVLGYLDDLILLPMGISLAVRMIPRPILEECRERASGMMAERMPTIWVAFVMVVAVWLLAGCFGVWLAWKALL